jgi:hypothetical protein
LAQIHLMFRGGRLSPAALLLDDQGEWRDIKDELDYRHTSGGAPAPSGGAASVQAQMADRDASTVKNCSRAADVLVLLTAGIAFVPVLGLGAWLFAALVVPAVSVLAIIVMTKGRTLRGVMMLIGAWLGVPLAILIGNIFWVGVIRMFSASQNTPPAAIRPSVRHVE